MWDKSSQRWGDERDKAKTISAGRPWEPGAEPPLRLGFLLPRLRPRTPAMLAAWLSLFLFLFTANAHMIDVLAGRKECFFEDLHKQDKVRSKPRSQISPLTSAQMTVTYQVGGGGHLDIDFWVLLLALDGSQSLMDVYIALRSNLEGFRKASQAVNRDTLCHSRQGRTLRILLLQSDERHCRQDC